MDEMFQRRNSNLASGNNRSQHLRQEMGVCVQVMLGIWESESAKAAQERGSGGAGNVGGW